MVSLLTLMTMLTAQASDPASARRALLEQRLRVRDPAPACEEITALSPDAADDLLWVMEHVQQPPWVGIRAAECVLLRHAEAQIDIIGTWVADPARRGLALLTLNMLDQLPEKVALHIGQAALNGPLKADAERRIASSSRSAIQALLTSTDESTVVPPDAERAQETSPSEAP